MKRMIDALCVVILLAANLSALAEVPQFSNSLFASGKDALVYLASGEYERLVTLLPFSDVSPSAGEWQDFAEGNFTTLANGVQTDYAVAYWNETDWRLAIPVSEPNDDSVEVLVLISPDGNTLTGYRYATWGEISLEYESASYTIWNKEYVPNAPVVTFD